MAIIRHKGCTIVCIDHKTYYEDYRQKVGPLIDRIEKINFVNTPNIPISISILIYNKGFKEWQWLISEL